MGFSGKHLKLKKRELVHSPLASIPNRGFPQHEMTCGLCRRMLYSFRKCVRKNLAYIVTFVFQFLCADYLKCINQTKTPMEICTGLVLRNLCFDRKYLNRLGILTGILIAIDFSRFFSKKYLQFRKKAFVDETFFSPCKSNWICIPRNYFSNYVYLKNIHINLKKFGNILFVPVLTNLPIYKFLNFTAVFTNKSI